MPPANHQGAFSSLRLHIVDTLRRACASVFRITRSAKQNAFWVSVLIGATAAPSSAQLIWTGLGANNDWSTAANWNNSTAPSNPSGSVLQFDGSTRLTPNVNSAWTVNGLQFNNTASAFTLSGAAITLRSASGIANLDGDTQTVNNALVLDVAQTFQTASSGSLVIGGTINNSGVTLTTNANTATTITLSGIMSGSGGLTLSSGTGNTTLSGASANTFTGTTQINSGLLNLSKTASVTALAHHVIIGDGTGTDTLRLVNSNQIADTSRITFTSGGTPTFDLNGQTETVGGISSTNTSAAISLSGGALTVGSTSSNLDSSFSGVISGTGTVAKAGTGTLTLNGVNTYSGGTTVSLGTLKLGAAGDATNSSLGSTASGTTVSSGASLDLNGVSMVATEALSLTGVGQNSTGALTNSGAAASFGGAITLAGATTLGGTGNMTLSGAIGGAQALTKVGTGTINLTAANTNSSTLTIRRGDLVLKDSGTMTSATGVTLATGGALTLDNTGTVNTNRLGSVGITANGGTLSFLHNGAASTNYSETLGTITANAGQLNIVLSQAAVGQTSQLTITNLTRAAGGTILISGTGIGGTQNQLITTGSLAGSGGIVVGALMTGHTGGSTYDLVTSGTTGAVTALTTYTAAESSWSSNNIEARPTASTAVTANRTVNALVLDSAINISAPSANRRITLDNAAMLVQTGGNSTIAASGTNETQLAFTNRQGTIYTIGNLTLERGDASGITGTSGVVKTGGGTFFNLADNANSGGLTINQGTWRAERAGGVSGGGTIAAWGGTLEVGNSTSTTFTNTNSAVNADFTFRADRALNSAGSGAGITHTLGTLSISNSANVTFSAGGNVTSDTIGLAIGTTTLNASDSTLNVGANLALTVASITGTNRSFAFNTTGNATVSGAITTGTGDLTKTGSGTLTLLGANTYTGRTLVEGGTLSLNDEARLGNNPGTFNAGQLTLDGGTLQTTATFALNDANRGVLLGAAGGTFAPSSATTFTIANPIAGPGALTLAGPGNVTLSGANTFDGGVTVSAGILSAQNASALGRGTAGTTVTSGATLELNGGITLANNGLLTLSGTGASSSGALVGGATGNNTFSGNITLSGDTTIKTNSSAGNYTAIGTAPGSLSRPVADKSTLSLGANTLTVAGGTASSIVYLNTQLTGSGGLTVDLASATGAVYLTAHQNTYTGLTTIKQGTLLPFSIPNTYPGDSSPSGVDQYYGILGNIQIGDGIAGNATLEISDLYGASRTNELLNYKSRVTLYTDGTLKVNSAQTLGGYDATYNPGNGSVGQSLVFNGGTIEIGSNGSLYLMGDVVVNATANQTATINGVGNTLSLTQHQGPSPVPNANRQFDVSRHVDSAASHLSDLTINAKVMNGSITKLGNGTLTLTGNNTLGYEGTTTINNGILAITHEGALGQGVGDSASGTIVNSGGTLRLTSAPGNLTGNLTDAGTVGVVNENLYLNGVGFNPGTGVLGALQNDGGDNTWAGNIILQSSSSIQSGGAGNLTLSGSVTSATDAALTVFGTGTTNISGAVGTGAGGIIKNDTGTLILSGVNTYGGNTEVNAGVLRAQNNNALGSAASGTTVTAGASLQLSGGITTIAEALTISGTGASTGGALHNYSGNNTFGGTVTLGSASGTTITSATGNTLTILGPITGNNTTPLTIGNGSHGGTVAMNPTVGSITGTVGATHLHAGTFSVGGTGTTTLNTGELTSLGGTTLVIGSGGTINSHFDNGALSNFYGTIGSGSAGTLALTGTNVGNEGTGFQFRTTFSAPSVTLKLGGATIGGDDLSQYFRLELSGVQITVGTIHITGDTILDFNGTAGTFLSSANLIIDAGVKISVQNWVSVADTAGSSTAWYLRSGLPSNGVLNPGNITLSGANDLVGGTPLNQISFTNYDGLTTTWVATNHNGWFDREIRPTPEPATYGALFLGGCVGLLGWRRYRTRRQAAPRS